MKIYYIYTEFESEFGPSNNEFNFLMDLEVTGYGQDTINNIPTQGSLDKAYIEKQVKYLNETDNNDSITWKVGEMDIVETPVEEKEVTYKVETLDDFRKDLMALGRQYEGDEDIDDEEAISAALYESSGANVQFELENVISVEIKTIKDFNYLLVQAGGDWEHFLMAVYYFDEDHNLNCYVPDKGNVYNRTSKMAYGNSETEGTDDDNTDSMKHYGVKVSECSDIPFDLKLIEEDIIEKFKL